MQFHVVQNQLPAITLAEAFSQDTAEMQGPVMWHQTQGQWLQSTHLVHDPYMGHLIHSVPEKVCVSQYRCSAPYWLPHHPKPHPDQHPTHWWAEACNVADQAERPCSYRHRFMNVRMWPGLTTGPRPPHSFLPQAGDSTRLAGWQQAVGPLLQRPGPGAGPTILTQVSETHLQGAGDSCLPKATSLEEAMKIFQCEPVPKQTSPVEAEIPFQELGSIPIQVSDEAPSPYTMDHSLDLEDLEACVQRLLDAHTSTEAQDLSVAAEDSGTEFDYEVDSLGRFCDL